MTEAEYSIYEKAINDYNKEMQNPIILGLLSKKEDADMMRDRIDFVARKLKIKAEDDFEKGYNEAIKDVLLKLKDAKRLEHQRMHDSLEIKDEKMAVVYLTRLDELLQFESVVEALKK